MPACCGPAKRRWPSPGREEAPTPPRSSCQPTPKTSWTWRSWNCSASRAGRGRADAVTTPKQRILHVYKDYYPVVGGIENHIRLLAEGQAAQGRQVAVLATSLTSRTVVEERGGVQVFKAGRAATVASMPISITLPIMLGRLRPHITHLHFPYPLGETAQLLFGRGRPTVITYHSDVVRQQGWLRLYEPILRRVLRRADCILATSPNYIQSSSYLQAVRDRCQVVPLGIEVARFRAAPAAAVADLRARFGAPLYLFVGRLRYYKGLPHLLQALQGLPGHLVVVGEGAMRSTWEHEARQLGVADRVHFVGEVEDEDLPTYYHACDLFILPATQRSEAFGAVLLEAMASGRPVISTELGTGTSWVNQDGETGLVVPPADPQALRGAMERLMDDEALRTRLGQEALRHAQGFDVRALVEQVLAVYDEVLSGPKTHRWDKE
ncbi:MAG: glycosyltransferase [Chloroflexi bacterium]|nr:glycosyltransferase [Chloroflexota bacterium]